MKSRKQLILCFIVQCRTFVQTSSNRCTLPGVSFVEIPSAIYGARWFVHIKVLRDNESTKFSSTSYHFVLTYLYIRGALTDFVCSVQVFAWIFRNRFMISSSCILLNIWGKCSSRKKYVYQRDFTLPCLSPEIDHRWRQKRGTWAVGRFCRWWQHDNMELTCFM